MNHDLQESVAMVCNVDDLVDGALQGFPVTVFAFGQTGSVSLFVTVCIFYMLPLELQLLTGPFRFSRTALNDLCLLAASHTSEAANLTCQHCPCRAPACILHIASQIFKSSA